MAVIVRHTESGSRYVLLGGGYGAWSSSRPSLMFGGALPEDRSGDVRVALVCDENGHVAWVESECLVVENVDGRHPSAILGE